MFKISAISRKKFFDNFLNDAKPDLDIPEHKGKMCFYFLTIVINAFELGYGRRELLFSLA